MRDIGITAGAMTVIIFSAHTLNSAAWRLLISVCLRINRAGGKKAEIYPCIHKYVMDTHLSGCV